VVAALEMRCIEFSTVAKVATLRDVLIAHERKRARDAAQTRHALEIVDAQRVKQLGLGTYIPVSGNGRCLTQSILMGIGEAWDEDVALCDKTISNMTAFLVDDEFSRLVVPELASTFSELCREYVSKNKFTVMGQRDPISIASIDEYAQLLRQRTVSHITPDSLPTHS
jgi:hypothetical protein